MNNQGSFSVKGNERFVEVENSSDVACGKVFESILK